ncbi:MAG: dicarboxylate/amino acid:cation symporter, partial [Steroidobacteraceae bacterium]
AGLAATGVPAGLAISIADIVGSLWLDALRMTIIPLVFSLLVTGVVTAAGTAALGGIAARAVLWFGLLLFASALFSALVAPLLLGWTPVDPADAATLRAGAGGDGRIPVTPPMSEWATSIIPANPVAAAAEGAMLPLVVFALFFGLAATRIGPELRERLTGFFQATGDTMLVIVHWVLWVAPVGVFALALGLGSRVGIGAVGALAHYVLLISSICILIGTSMYVLIRLLGMPLRRFARAALPPQVVAVSTQSSLASLPAMIESAQQNLGASPRVAGLVLPLAVSVFRITSPAANLAVVLFVGSLYGVEPGVPQLATGAVVAAVMSLAVVSLPQASFFTAIVPIAAAMGIPIEVLPVLFAVEMIPDVFRTVSNVTADLAVTGIVARRENPDP